MLEDLITDNPGDTFYNMYDAFISYFSGLTLPAQVITGTLIILGLFSFSILS